VSSPTEQQQIVTKGTPQFKEAQIKYLDLFFNQSKEADWIPKAPFSYGEHKGQYLGMTSKKIQEAKLPMPFGCPSLFINPTKDKSSGKLSGIIWFCEINGTICVCCREDFTKPTEAYPAYCPKYEVDDCTLHEGDCDACPSNGLCHDTEEPEEWEVEAWGEQF
jgi:hypothetical protein